jgi:hypothetical protein
VLVHGRATGDERYLRLQGNDRLGLAYMEIWKLHSRGGIVVRSRIAALVATRLKRSAATPKELSEELGTSPQYIKVILVHLVLNKTVEKTTDGKYCIKNKIIFDADFKGCNRLLLDA